MDGDTAMSKYHSVKVKLDGYTFDSKAEAARYGELCLLAKAGEITELKIHPDYQLINPFRYKGGWERGVIYEGDFEYLDSEGVTVVEDVKGMMTPLFRIKRKLFIRQYPNIDFRIIQA
jgi:hypothetical protein